MKTLLLALLGGASLAGAAPSSEQLDPHDPALRCHGVTSPTLTFGPPPPGTRSLAVVVWDQQPTRLTGRWLVYDLPVGTRQLPARPATTGQLAGGIVGPNSLGHRAFQAPCDAGARDLYVDLYALKTARLPLPSHARFAQIHAALHTAKLLEAKAHLTWVVR